MSDEVQAAIAELLARRGEGKTICPSEAARLLAGEGGDWRAKMAQVHHAVDTLLDAGEVRISRKGEKLDRRRGAYRIARRQSCEEGPRSP